MQPRVAGQASADRGADLGRGCVWHDGPVPQTHHVDLCIIGSGSGNSDPRRPLRRARASRWSTTVRTSAAPASMSAASRPRCTSTRPTWPAPHSTPAPLGVDLTLDRVRWDGDPGPRLRSDRRDLGGRGALSGREPQHQPVPAAGEVRRRQDDCDWPTAPRSSPTGTCSPPAAASGLPAVDGLDDDPVRDLRHRDAAARAAPDHDHRRSRVRRRGVRPRLLRVRHGRHRGRSSRPDAATRGRRHLRAVHPAARRAGRPATETRAARRASRRRRLRRRGRGDRPERPGHPSRGRAAGGHRTDSQRRPPRPRPDRGRRSTTTGTWWSTTSSAPRPTRSSPSATSAPTTSSSTWPTTRPGWYSTTCCTPRP